MNFAIFTYNILKWKKLKNGNLLVKVYISNHATSLLKIFLGSLLLCLVPSEDHLLVEWPRDPFRK